MTQIQDTPVFDLAIIGGGVNGCGVARDAAGRGASVVLFEKGDLASATSSASTKLIHGGLRYLEQYEFRLVHEALSERAVLARIAPHMVTPLRFILPHHKGLRPRWLLRIGLFLYDHLGWRGGLKGTESIDLATDPVGAPLKDEFRYGFAYSDCWTDDARLVTLNAMSARELGADIRVRTRVTEARREHGLWRIESEDADGAKRPVFARALVNATGPWVNDTLGLAAAKPPHGVRLVQGSHIVTEKLFDHDKAYIFQNGDGRVIFAIPYREEFTLIGTTDQDWTQPLDRITASEEEIAYLCSAASEYFKAPVEPGQVVWSYSGVRALADEGKEAAQEASRDYVLTLDAPAGEAALLSVYGGKITTYRRLAESAMEKLKAHLPAARKPAWTGTKSLPGGNLGKGGLAKLAADLNTQYPELPPPLLKRLAFSYGSRAKALLGEARTMEDLGEVFAADLTQREVDLLVAQEWAQTAEDILWRRSKIGLHASSDQTARLEAYLAGGRNTAPFREAALR